MVLTKDELLSLLRNEVRLLEHLVSKADPAKLDYRPGPKQRSTLELLQYLAIMPRIHFRHVMASAFDMDAFGRDWNEAEASAKTMKLDQVKEAIGRQPAMFEELLGPCSGEYLREEVAMFGGKTSRGEWLVSLVLVHYAAYRMQFFLYLKASGREELNTMNLWVGRDGAL